MAENKQRHEFYRELHCDAMRCCKCGYIVTSITAANAAGVFQKELGALHCPGTFEQYLSSAANAIIHSASRSLAKELEESAVKCECGAEAAGVGGHSHWCPKAEK